MKRNIKTTHPEVQEIWSLIRENQKSTQEGKKEMADIREVQRQTVLQMKETDFRMEKSRQKLDRQIEKTIMGIEELKKTQREIDLRMEKSHRETDRHIQKIGARFNDRWGALIESLVEGKLVSAFRERDLDVKETYSRAVSERKDPNGIISFGREADIIVANGKEVVLVEVKTTLHVRDVKIFLAEQLKDFKHYFKPYASKTVYGAVAFLRSANNAHVVAEKEGLFIIKATGDSARIINEKDFKPKIFP